MKTNFLPINLIVVIPAYHNEPVDTQPYNEEYETISTSEENLQQMQQEVESSLQNIKISLPNEPSASELSSSQPYTYRQRIAAQYATCYAIITKNLI